MKALIQTLLFLFLITPLYFAQLYEVSPNSPNMSVYPSYQNQEANDMEYWELFFSFDVTATSGGSGNYGAEFDGTYFYTTRWASNLMHKYDINGNLIEEFSIPGVWGIRDLTFDGIYMYGGTRTNTIYQMDFNTKALVGTIPSPVTVGFIAYDQTHDAFWCGSWYEGPALVSRSGNVITSFYTGLQHMSGAELEGSYLYIFDQGQGQGFHQIIYEIDILTGLLTGETIDVTEDFPGTNGISGGLFSPDNIGYGPAAIGGLLQNDPDLLFAYSNHWYIPPYSENFDSFTTGQRTACQKPLYWSTWNLTPCDSTDPFISQNQSISNPNSVVISENNDLVQLHQPLTYGVWNVNFQFYIPSGKTGQFGLMAQFLWGDKIYGMECYLNQGGEGRLFIGDTVDFTWTENTWQMVNMLINLEDDQAVMILDTSTIASWQWSRGGAIPGELDANYFRGAGYSEMYIDDYHFGDYIPVELTSFRADIIESSIVLSWKTATEMNNRGFDIERQVGSKQSTVGNWEKIGFVPGFGTTTEPKSYLFTDAEVAEGIYKYRLKQIDFDGSNEYSNVVEVNITTPTMYSLEQNYPNPFNPNTIIKYSVPLSSYVEINVYDILGNEIETLINEEKPAGTYEITWYAEQLPSGVYFYQLLAGDYINTKKMILLK